MCQLCVQNGLPNNGCAKCPCDSYLSKRKPARSGEFEHLDSPKGMLQNMHPGMKTISEEMSELAKHSKNKNMQSLNNADKHSRTSSRSPVYGIKQAPSVDYNMKDNFAFGSYNTSQIPNNNALGYSGNNLKSFAKINKMPHPQNNNNMMRNAIEVPNMNIEVPRQQFGGQGGLNMKDLREDVRLLIHMQNFYMSIVSKQNESIIGSLTKLTNSIDGLRKSLSTPEGHNKNRLGHGGNQNENQYENVMPSDFEVCTKTSLLKSITSQTQFQYKIVLKTPLQQPLIKERNFRLDLQ